MRLGELVEKLGGKLVQGRADTVIRGVNSGVQARPEHLVFAQDPASASDALSSNAGAVVLRPGLVDSYPEEKAIVETPQPRLWFSRAAKALKPVSSRKCTTASAVIGAN